MVSRMVLACLLLNGGGFLLGWMIPRLAGQSVQAQHTISIEWACRTQDCPRCSHAVVGLLAPHGVAGCHLYGDCNQIATGFQLTA